MSLHLILVECKLMVKDEASDTLWGHLPGNDILLTAVKIIAIVSEQKVELYLVLTQVFEVSD